MKGQYLVIRSKTVGSISILLIQGYRAPFCIPEQLYDAVISRWKYEFIVVLLGFGRTTQIPTGVAQLYPAKARISSRTAGPPRRFLIISFALHYTAVSVHLVMLPNSILGTNC